jgi:hypothetical protein
MVESNLPSTISSKALSEQLRLERRIAELVARLLRHYWTADDHPASRQAQIEDWLEDLTELPIECVEEACREWRRTQPDKRPGPGHIRMLAIVEQRRRNPSPEPVYLPAPEPRIADPIRRVEMARRMGELAQFWRRASRGKEDVVDQPGPEAGERGPPSYEDPEALRRGRVELGLEP